jgi:hypothetical protein
MTFDMVAGITNWSLSGCALSTATPLMPDRQGKLRVWGPLDTTAMRKVLQWRRNEAVDCGQISE